MKYTHENLSCGLTPEYVSACKSLEMFMRRTFGTHYNGSYNRGAVSERHDIYWFAPPSLDGVYYCGGYSWVTCRRNGTFGVGFTFGDTNKYMKIEAKIPCNKLSWTYSIVPDCKKA